MQKLRRTISFLYLFLLVFISIPKEFVHHCEVSHAHELTTNTENISAKCAVCDFDFYQNLPCQTCTVERPVVFYLPQINEIISDVLSYHPVFISNKAPPANLI